MRFSYLTSIAILCGVYNLVSATPITCPPNIQTIQSLKSEMSEWVPYTDTTDSQHVLETVTFYDQHPKQQASLSPDNERGTDNKLLWTFDPNRDIWIDCRDANTNLQLIQKL